jgi:hypothetical protein
MKRTRQESEAQVKVLKKLQNPFALVLQGFIAGGVLFWTTQGEAARPAAAPAPVPSSISAN